MNQILQFCVLQRFWRDIVVEDFNYIFSEDVELNRINQLGRIFKCVMVKEIFVMKKKKIIKDKLFNF